MKNPLKRIVRLQKEGNAVGIYSACSANEYVIKAVIEAGKRDNSYVLIESTANQCDQFGGYTGMKPLDFKNFVEGIADKLSFDKEKIFLGGDHLGPLTWTHLPEAEAMENATELVKQYVLAGFTKIHIDTSMKVADDDENTRLSDDVIAARGAKLVKVAQDAYANLLETNPDAVELVFIVGSEVPIPGGAQGGQDTGVQITTVSDFKATVATFKNHFDRLGLQDAWENVIAVVVQPGVEEKDAGCTEYDRSKAVDLMASIHDFPNLVFEGHSTDYQTKIKLRELVEDGVAILKVGPGLTFSLREALFALASIEREYYKNTGVVTSNLLEVLEEAMLAEPKYWQKHYTGTTNEIALKRQYSFSDRCRYYLPMESVNNAIITLFDNLKDGAPLNLLTQFMPIQYTKVREGNLENSPEALVIDRIMNTIDEYMFATKQNEL